MPSFHVAIIGGGASGVLTAAQLHRQQPDLSVALIDSTGSGRGLAYGTPHLAHLLNVPAGNMSAFPDQPEHFHSWLRQIDPWAARTTFAPRKLYGDYLNSVLDEACKAPSKVERITGTAVAVERGGEGPSRWRVVLGDGTAVKARNVVLALGNLPPALLSAARNLKSERYFNDPWVPGAVDVSADAEQLTKAGSVLLIGTGLTAIDVILALKANGHTGPIHCISRRGLLPRSHAPCEPWKLSEDLFSPPVSRLPSPASSPHTLLKWLRAEVRRAEGTGGNPESARLPAGPSARWRAVIDALRPHTARIWHGWPEAEKRRFLRHVRAHWEVHRHRAAPEISNQIEKLMATGLLQIHQGRLVAISESGSSVRVRWLGKNRMEWELEVDRVFNCTGPESDYARLDQPLIAQMREAGLLVPDRLRLGIETDERGRVLDQSGAPVEGLLVLGPLRKARLWESTAMPEIRVQAEECAREAGVIMRKQYYFRPSERGLLAWDVDRLVALSKSLPRKQVLLSDIRELDEPWVGEDARRSWREVVTHMKLIEEADLAFPIILSATGAVMDGRHRVAKAALQGRDRIEAVQFTDDPPPDHIGVGPDDLPY